MKSNNFDKAEELMRKAFNAYAQGNKNEGDMLKEQADNHLNTYLNENDTQKIDDIYGSNKNFGIIHAIFEHNAPDLYQTKKGRKIIAKYIKTIKEDTCLSKQFSFYNEMMNVNDVIDPMSFVNEAIDIFPKLNKKNIVESNSKLINIIKENGINEDIDIDEHIKNLFESIECVITNKKNIKNLSAIINAKNNISNFISEHVEKDKGMIKEDKYSGSLDEFASSSLLEFNNKYSEVLNDDEKVLIKAIMSAKFNGNDNACLKIFESYKTSTLKAITEAINDSDGDIKNKLLSLKEKTLDKTFDIQSVTNDLLEMIDIKNVLEEE